MRKSFAPGLLVIALLSVPASPVILAQQDASRVGRQHRPGLVEVGKVQGACTISKVDPRDGKPKGQANLTRGLTFTEGHMVRTTGNDSLLELVFSNGAILRLVGQASIEIKTFTQVPSVAVIPGKFREIKEEPSSSIVQIELFYGKLVGEAHKLSPDSVFTIKTPVGLTRIRGTIWSDEFRRLPGDARGEQVSLCAKGVIEVRDLAGSDPGVAKEGQQVVVTGPISVSEQAPRRAGKPGQPEAAAVSDSTTEVKSADAERLRQVMSLVEGGG